MTARPPSSLLAVLTVGCTLAFASPAAATAPSFTWNGAGVNTSTGWSNGGNWEGTAAPIPSESLGTLMFPQLASCSGPLSCYHNNNDVSGLSANAVSVVDTAGYNITGQSLALGSGGITASPDSSVNASVPDVVWAVPLTLTAAQNWLITGAGTGFCQGNLGIEGPVTGSSTLGVQLANQACFSVTAGMEVAAFTAVGSNSADTGFNAAQNGIISPTSMNSSPAHPVSVTDVVLSDQPNVDSLQPHVNQIGPLTATGAFLQVGDGNVPDGTLAVQGAVTLNSGTVTQFAIDQSGITPSTDYSQLTAAGNISLGGTLSISSANCSMGTGSTDTLITTSGALSGTFANAPGGALVSFQGCPSLAARINYTASSVTATVVSGSGTSTTLSASPTAPETNQPVTATATVTAGTPLQAGPAGTVEFLDGTSPIAGCTAQPLTATSATSGSAACTASFLAAASPVSLTAVFTPAGGSSLTGSGSQADSLSIGKGLTAASVTASSAAAIAGHSVTYTAHVTPAYTGSGIPTGAVRFADGSATITGCASQPISATGLASCTATPAVGSHSITASYGGDANFIGSTSSGAVVAVHAGVGRPSVGRPTTRGTTLSVPVTCTGSARCTVRLDLTAAETLKGGKLIAVTASRRKIKKKVIGLGSVSATVAPGHTRIVKLTLNRTGKRLLAKRHKLPTMLRISRLTSGRTTTITTKTVTFKAKPSVRTRK